MLLLSAATDKEQGGLRRGRMRSWVMVVEHRSWEVLKECVVINELGEWESCGFDDRPNMGFRL